MKKQTNISRMTQELLAFLVNQLKQDHLQDINCGSFEKRIVCNAKYLQIHTCAKFLFDTILLSLFH